MTRQLDEGAVIECLRASATEMGSAKAWATAMGLSPQYVSDVLRGRSAPGDSILRRLGLQKSISYVPREPEVIDLVDADGEVLVRAEAVFS